MNGDTTAVAGRVCLEVEESIRAAATVPDDASVMVAAGRSLYRVGGSGGIVEKRLPCEPRALSYAPGGERLGLGCRGGAIMLLAADSHEVQAELRGEAAGYHELAWSPDGQIVAAGRLEPFVDIVDVGRGELVRVLDPEIFDDEGRTAVTFTPDGTVLATTAYNAVLLWDSDALMAPTGRVRRRSLRLHGHHHLLDLAVAPDGATIAALSESEGTSALHLWDVQSGKKRVSVDLPHVSARMVWSHSGGFFAIGEVLADGVTLLSVEDFQPLEMWLDGAAGDVVTALVLSADERLIVAGTDRGRVLQWQVEGVGS